MKNAIEWVRRQPRARIAIVGAVVGIVLLVGIVKFWRGRELPFVAADWKAAQTKSDHRPRHQMIAGVKALLDNGTLRTRSAVLDMLGPPDEIGGVSASYALGPNSRRLFSPRDWLVIQFDARGELVGYKIKHS